MTTTLRLRAATLTLALAAATAVGTVAAVPAHASDPCAPAYNTYKTDTAKADAYYAQYKHSTGATRQKAYDSYVQWHTAAQRALKDYDTCLHNH